MVNVIAIVQARLGSRRLPRKTFLELPKRSGVTVIERVFERLDKCRMPDRIVLATPDEEIKNKVYDSPIIRAAKKPCGVSLTITSKRDVLTEYVLAARRWPARHYVRITGDCPLIMPEVVDYVTASHLSSGADYTYNHNDIDGDMTGDGQDVEVFTWETLVRTWVLDQTPEGREHVTPFMKNFKTNKVEPYAWEGRSMNTKEDYKLLCKIYDKYKLV